MDDYINREDAFNIKNYLKRFGCFGDNGFVEIEGVLIALSKIPSADVAPARHGRWEEQQKEYGIYSCSECNKVALFEKWGDMVKPYDYCPNCGAKMDGVDTDA